MKAKVAVYLGSSPGDRPIYVETAREIGRRLAEKGHTIIYGGAEVGTMGALADGALSAGGKIIGVFPEGFAGRKEIAEQGIEVVSRRLSEMVFTLDFAERKQRMEDMSDCAVVLPGSFGTMDELFNYVLNQEIGYHSKPVFVLNLEGYYDPLRDLIQKMVSEGFIPGHYDITFCDSADKLLSLLDR